MEGILEILFLRSYRGRRRPVTGTLLADWNGWPQSTTPGWREELEGEVGQTSERSQRRVAAGMTHNDYL